MVLTTSQMTKMAESVKAAATRTAPLRRVRDEADRTITRASDQIATEAHKQQLLSNELHELESQDPKGRAFSLWHEILVMAVIIVIDFKLNAIAAEAFQWSKWTTWLVAAGFTVGQAILVYLIAAELRERRRNYVKAEVNA